MFLAEESPLRLPTILPHPSSVGDRGTGAVAGHLGGPGSALNALRQERGQEARANHSGFDSLGAE